MNGSIAQRVARGVALLDKERPGWWRTDIPAPIDLDALDLDVPCRCVLGQLFAGDVGNPDDAYSVGLAELGLGESLTHMSDYRHGFDGDADNMRLLTYEWQQVITWRRDAQASERR